jgi:hypothetical protein
MLGILSLWTLDLTFFEQGQLPLWGRYQRKPSWPLPPAQIRCSCFMPSGCRCTCFLTSFCDRNTEILLNSPHNLLSSVGHFLTTRTDIDAQNLWMTIANQALEVYAAKTDVCCSLCILKTFFTKLCIICLDCTAERCTR